MYFERKVIFFEIHLISGLIAKQFLNSDFSYFFYSKKYVKYILILIFQARRPRKVGFQIHGLQE